MSEHMVHTVEFHDVTGEKNIIAFYARTEAEEFMDSGEKRWHFSDLKYHYYTIKEFIEEKKKLQ